MRVTSAFPHNEQKRTEKTPVSQRLYEQIESPGAVDRDATRLICDTLRKSAPWILFIVAFMSLQSSVEAQGLICAPHECGNLGRGWGLSADYEYDRATDIVRLSIYAIPFLGMMVLGCLRIKDARQLAFWKNKAGVCVIETNEPIRRRTWQISLLILPVLFYLAGIFALCCL